MVHPWDEIPKTDPLYELIRGQQVAGPVFGPTYAVLYELDRVIRRDWYDLRDRVEMPKPILRFGRLEGARLAEYCRYDSTFSVVVTIDPTKHRTLLDVAEYLVHEYVHLWMDWLRYSVEENGDHGKSFRAHLTDAGIISDDKGEHVGFLGNVWGEWLAKIEDELSLTAYLLSDEPSRPSRKQTYECPTCSLLVEHRKTDLALRCQHGLSDDELCGEAGALMKLRDTVKP
jgi:hypothetical protein